ENGSICAAKRGNEVGGLKEVSRTGSSEESLRWRSAFYERRIDSDREGWLTYIKVFLLLSPVVAAAILGALLQLSNVLTFLLVSGIIIYFCWVLAKISPDFFRVWRACY